MIVIGLTGSIGMGKTTVATMLQQLGVKVHDADAAAHDLQQPGSPAMASIAAAFPYFEYPNLYGKKIKGVRSIKRGEMVKIVLADMEKLDVLENILHPLVREAQNKFIRDAKKMGQEIVALDIPLLFETGGDEFVDVTIAVSAPYLVQRKRVLERATMNQEKFEAILNRQMPDVEKCERADFVIHSGLGRAHTMKEVKTVLNEIRQG